MRPAVWFGYICREAIWKNADGRGSGFYHPMWRTRYLVVPCGRVSAGAAPAMVVGTGRFYYRVHDSGCFSIAAPCRRECGPGSGFGCDARLVMVVRAAALEDNSVCHSIIRRK